jgi:hypothetical protein
MRSGTGCGAQCVDDRGWLWIVSCRWQTGGHRRDWGQDGKTIYALAPRGLDKLGNPIYDWKDAVRVVAPTVGRGALRLDEKVDFGWKLVNASSADGMIYALANANKSGLAGERACTWVATCWSACKASPAERLR